jgi:hypothetical protein
VSIQKYLRAEHNALHALQVNCLYCPEFTIIEKPYNIFDAIAISATTRVLIEMKVREETASRFYGEGAMLEQKKFYNLKEERDKDKTKPPVLYINSFADGYLFIWDITRHFYNNTLVSGSTICPWHTFQNDGKVLKPVFYLAFQNSDWILHNNTYERISNQTFVAEMERGKAETNAFISEFTKNFNIDL